MRIDYIDLLVKKWNEKIGKIDEGTKVCLDCGIRKPKSEFKNRDFISRGKEVRCEECNNIYRKLICRNNYLKRKLKNKEKHDKQKEM